MQQLEGNILLTGGTGTIGHAISLAAKKHQWPCSITVFSRSEERQARMARHFPEHRYVLGDIQDYEHLTQVAIGHDVIIHAAATKRIPEAEQQPWFCTNVNVFGSMNVMRAARKADVLKVVGISTDKACQPITMYGYTKSLMEGLFRAEDPNALTTYHLVRYGNVVASAGSVIQLWSRLHAEGRPLGITHRDMSRFWMSPFKAVEMIVAALDIGPGETLVSKVGGMRVEDMARAVFPEAKIFDVGLRSSEKLAEDLVAPYEYVASEQIDSYVLARGREGKTGITFSSANASRINAHHFLSMLEDAREVEALQR